MNQQLNRRFSQFEMLNFFMIFIYKELIGCVKTFLTEKYMNS